MEAIKMVQWVRLFVLQAEGPEFNLQKPREKQGMVAHAWSLCAGETKAGGLGLLASQPIISDELHAFKRPCLKGSRWDSQVPGIREAAPWPPDM